MERLDIWTLIQNGQFEEACKNAEAEFNETKNILPLRNKVYALLHLKKYNNVVELCEMIITFTNSSSDSDFILCGIAHWLLNQKEKAIEVWQKGKNTKYTDAAGGIEIQILLYFASVKINDERLKMRVVNNISKLLKLKTLSDWPIPLGRFLINQINETELLGLALADDLLKSRKLCQAWFVIAIKKIENGEMKEYLSNLGLSISDGPSAYLEHLYYLAIGELNGSISMHEFTE